MLLLSSLAVLILAVGCYASFRTDAFLTALNIKHILLATAPLALVTMAQFNVLLVRGFDVSVGAVISLTVVIGSLLMAEDMNTGLILLGALVCPAVGVIVGLSNGALVRHCRHQLGDHHHRHAQRGPGHRAYLRRRRFGR